MEYSNNTNAKYADIIFCTLAYGKRYRDNSIELLKSYRKHDYPHRFVIFTDDTSYYDDMDKRNIDVVQIHLEHAIRPQGFTFSAKLFPIKYCAENYIPQVIQFLDADSLFNEKQNFKELLFLEEGFNGMIGTPIPLDDLVHNGIVRKINKTHRDGEKIYLFREQALLFRIKSKKRFLNFLNEWEKLYDLTIELKLHQHYECVDIGVACQRSGFPLVRYLDNTDLLKKFSFKDAFLKDNNGVWTSPYPK